MARGRPREREPRKHVGKGNDVPTGAMDDLFNGVKGSAVTGAFCHKILRFSRLFQSFSRHHLSVVSYLDRKGTETAPIFDEVADRGNRGTDELAVCAKWFQKLKHLVFPEVGVFGTKTSDFIQDRLRPSALSNGLWTTRLFIQRFKLPTPFLLLVFPEEEGAPFDWKRVDRCFEPMVLPEGEDAGFLLCFVGNHTGPAYGIVGESDKAADSVRYSVNLHTP